MKKVYPKFGGMLVDGASILDLCYDEPNTAVDPSKCRVVSGNFFFFKITIFIWLALIVDEAKYSLVKDFLIANPEFNEG